MQPVTAAPEQELRRLPKADIHLHSEGLARRNRLIALRDGVAPYDWSGWVEQTVALPPGSPRLEQLIRDPLGLKQGLTDQDDPLFVDWVTDVLEEAAGEHVILAEVRFGAAHALRPAFMSRFRQAERRVSERHPGFCAEALISGMWPSHAGAEDIFEACLRARHDGLAGIDFIPGPYASEADWTRAYVWADRAADAGLGITAHAGEISPANIDAALSMPGLTRLGHAVHAVDSTDLLQRIAKAGVTVECCLTSNQVLGAVPSLEAHPIRQLTESGVPVTLNTDDPVRMCTTISREYAQAEALGYEADDLLSFTRNAIASSFTTKVRRAELLAAITPMASAR